MKKHMDFESKIRHSGYKRKKIRVVGVRYVPTLDADLRLSRAIDILLRSAARDAARSEKRANAKKKHPLGHAPAPFNSPEV